MDATAGGPAPTPGRPGVWERVLAVMERLAASSNLDEVLSLINDSMRDCLSAERASVFRYDARRDELVAAQAHGVGEALRLPATAGLAGLAVQRKSIINVPDCYADPRFNPDVDRRTGFRTKAMLTVPLASLDGTVEGVAQVLNKRAGSSETAFSAEDELIARALASQAAVAIRRAALLDAERRRLKMEADLRVAQIIQAATRPGEAPRVAGYSFDMWSLSPDETAGDCFDVVQSAEGLDDAREARVWCFVADAAGHGVGPALAAAHAQALFRMGVRAGLSLETLLQHMNADLCKRLPVGMFVSAFVGVLDSKLHAMRYAAAGFSPVIHLPAPPSARAPEMLSATMPPLGVEHDIEPGSISTLKLGPGEAVIIATDGLFEQPSPGGQRLSEPDLLSRGIGRLLQDAGLAPHAPELSAALRDAAADHRGGAPLVDDQTLIVICRHESGPAVGSAAPHKPGKVG